MRKYYLPILILVILTLNINAQTFDGSWSTDYVTADDPASNPNDNYTGYNTIAVAVLSEDNFVAVVNRNSRSSHYLVGYRDATHYTGRLGTYEYSPQEKQMRWVYNFDQEFLNDVNDVEKAYDNIFYVANNNDNHSILAFELGEDSVYTHPQRYMTGDDYLWGIDVDANGRVYVLKAGDSTNAGSVMILEDPNTEPAWTSTGRVGTVLQEFDMPEVGSVRGIAVDPTGQLLFVSNWDMNKVYCFVGNPVDGYTQDTEFSFEVDNQFTTPTFNSLLNVGPHGLNYMPDKNILFVTHDTDYYTGDGYEYGRIYLVNPNSGDVVDTIDVAEWNHLTDEDGKYDDPDSLGLSSGYTSVNNVAFDENYNVYSQTFYGWAIDKRRYSDEVPTIDLDLVGVEKITNELPNKFSLKQNYPNPFNPTTTIEFGIVEKSNITIKVYSITGELISNLIDNQEYSSGSYKVTFDASNLASGTYIYTLDNGIAKISKKMSLLK